MSDLFFAKTHLSLESEYDNSCSLIAVQLARLLGAEGNETKIRILRGHVIDDAGNRATLVPKPYSGSVRWGAHVVCLAGNVVHDPMLERPLPLEEYLDAAFAQPVDVSQS